MSRSTVLAGVASAVLAAGAAFLVLGALTTGITIDEPTQVSRTDGWLEHGWFVPKFALTEGEPNETSEQGNPYVYGPAFAGLAHVANVVLGNEGLGDVAGTRAAFEVRHLTAVLLALVGAAAAGTCAWLLTGSRLFALWTAAALIAIPAWTGHGFFNPKDTPAAVGYTLLTTGLVAALARAVGPPARSLGPWAIGGMVGAGVWLGAGTRIALMAAFVVTLAAYAALRLAQTRLGSLKPDGGKADVAVITGALCGFAGIAAIYPKAFRSPFDLVTELFSASAEYPYSGVTLTIGRLLSEHPPPWYLPLWVWASLPLLLTALIALAIAAEGRGLLGKLRTARGSLWSERGLGVWLVLLQALMLPTAAVLFGSVMYTGMRQHLYMLPALAILAGLGAFRLWAWTSTARSHLARPLATCVLSLALVVPVVEQGLLLPYTYTYVNPVAGIGGVNDRWETDYWFASAREAISQVPADATLACGVTTVESQEADSEEVGAPCVGPWVEGFLSEQGTSADRAARPGETWLVLGKRAGNEPTASCEEGDSVTRWLRGEEVIMSYVLRCPGLAVSPDPRAGGE